MSAPEHLALAEQGKRAALRGDHPGALQQYRRAIQLVVKTRAPEVFFRHYLEASLESLELLGALDEVLSYCHKAVAHYQQNPPPNQLAKLDLASIYQRQGVVLLKRGERILAKDSFELALKWASAAEGQLELSRLLLTWLVKGLTISPERVLREQHRLHYFSVRTDALR
jgi:tetratricopeptide (TPR) repeat protein